MNGLLMNGGVWVAAIMYVFVAILYGDVLNDYRLRDGVEPGPRRAEGETGWDVLKTVGPKALAWPLVAVSYFVRYTIGGLVAKWEWMTTERNDND